MTSPFAYLEFNRVWAKAYVSSGLNAPKLFFELDDVLSRCQRKPTFLYWWVFVAGMGNYFLLDNFLNRESATNTPLHTTMLAFAVVGGIWAAWAGFMRTARTSVIRLQRRVEVLRKAY